MAELLPLYLENAGPTAQMDRINLQDLTNEAQGVLGAYDLKVESSGGMNITIRAGSALIPAGMAWRGTYKVANDATVTKALAASNASLHRQDRVIAHLYDTTTGDTSDGWKIEVLTGTNTAGTAAAPVAPVRSITLALINVGNGVASITQANIVDMRVMGRIRERTFYIDNSDQSVDTTLTSSTFTDWPKGQNFTIPLPPWASLMYVQTYMANIQSVTALADFSFYHKITPHGFPDQTGQGYFYGQTRAGNIVGAYGDLTLVDAFQLPDATTDNFVDVRTIAHRINGASNAGLKFVAPTSPTNGSIYRSIVRVVEWTK